MAEALYRKYRPQTFAEVVGQTAIERTLMNAVSRDKVSHAYLFCGPRGTGKTTTARLLAKALLCEQGPTPDPCCVCEDCRGVADGSHPDVFELDAASRTGVDNVREEIIGRVAYAPVRGRFKIYIIDEVHMLSVAAFNALLKTLEEPPAHVVFILCTTDPQKVPDTIVSRCQRFDFKRIGTEEIAARLLRVCEGEGIVPELEALDLLARHARGGMRDALTALEAVIAHDGGEVTLEGAREVVGEGDSVRIKQLADAVAARDVAACFAWVDEAADAGVDMMAAAGALAGEVRNAFAASVMGRGTEAGAFAGDRGARALMVLGDLLTELKTSANPRLSFEIALVRLARPAGDLTLEALAERVEALELTGVVAAPAPIGAAPAPSCHPEARSAEGSRPTTVPAAKPALVAASSCHPEARSAEGSRPVAQAPAPVAPAVPAAPQPEPVSEGRMKAAWPSVLAQLKKISAASSALFADASPRVAPNGDVEVIFPDSNAFAFRAAQTTSHSANFAAALNRVLGRAVPFSLKMGGSSAAPAPSAMPPRPAAKPAQAPQRPAPSVPVWQRPAPVAPAAAAVAAPAAPAAPAAAPAAPAPAVPAPAPAAPVPPPPEDDAPIPEDFGTADDYDDAFASFSGGSDSLEATMSDFFADFGASFEEYEL